MVDNTNKFKEDIYNQVADSIRILVSACMCDIVGSENVPFFFFDIHTTLLKRFKLINKFALKCLNREERERIIMKYED